MPKVSYNRLHSPKAGQFLAAYVHPHTFVIDANEMENTVSIHSFTPDSGYKNHYLITIQASGTSKNNTQVMQRIQNEETNISKFISKDTTLSSEFAVDRIVGHKRRALIGSTPIDGTVEDPSTIR